jgi:hypothetical protein
MFVFSWLTGLVDRVYIGGVETDKPVRLVHSICRVGRQVHPNRFVQRPTAKWVNQWLG